MLRFFVDSIIGGDRVRDPAVFSGLGDLLGQMEDIVTSARRSLDADALSKDLKISTVSASR